MEAVVGMREGFLKMAVEADVPLMNGLIFLFLFILLSLLRVLRFIFITINVVMNFVRIVVIYLIS